MRRTHVLSLVVVSTAALSTPSPAQTAAGSGGAGGSRGAATFYTDQTTFETAHPGLASEDFEDANAAAGSTVAAPDPAHAGCNDGVAFDEGDVDPGLWVASTGGGGLSVVNQASAYPDMAIVGTDAAQAIEVYFPGGDVTAVGLDLVALGVPGNHDIEVFDTDGNSVGATSVTPAVPGPTFFGVDVSGCNIGSITISDTLGLGQEGIDNVQYDGTRYVMNADPRSPSIGQNLDLFSAGGTSGNLGLNVVVSIDGSPFFYILLPKFFYNPVGVRLQGGPLPNDPNLQGHSLGVICFTSQDPGNTGPVVATNEQVFTIQ